MNKDAHGERFWIREPVMQCNMGKANSQLTKLVKAALAGEEVLIAKRGVPVVRLVKIVGRACSRKPGAWAALPKARADWDAAKSNAEIADALIGAKRL